MPTVCRTAATPGGPKRARVPCWAPPRRVSAGLAGGASQCSSGTLRSHPPAPGQSAGSAAGRTGTPLLRREKRKEKIIIHTFKGPQCHRETFLLITQHTLRAVRKSVDALKFGRSHHHQAQYPSQRLPQNFHNSGEAVTWGEG